MRIEKDGNIKNSNFKVQQYNNNVDKKSFIIDRLFFGNYENGDDETKNLYENNPVDLVDCNVSILLTNPDDKINEGSNLYITNLNGDTPTTEDDKISINWLLDRNITNYSGKRSFQLVFSKNNGDIVLRTKVMSFSVLSSLDTEENIIELAPSLIQEWDNKLKDILNQANDFNDYADNKINEKFDSKMHYYKEHSQEFITDVENQNNFAITMEKYYKNECVTQVYVNGIRNTLFTINENNEIVFNTPIAVIGTKIEVFVLKSIIADSVDLETLKGIKGDKGDAFTYDDFTQEQLEGLKVKGDKGDPFVYEDFTPEQLEGLKGEPGSNDYNDLLNKPDLSKYAKKGDLHSHENKSVLDGISQENIDNWNNKNEYTLPIASSEILGGVKIGANLSIDNDGVLSAIGGSSSGSGNENYSTEETVIGTWIDGKTIYRRVVEFTFSSTLNTWNLITPQTFTSLLKCCGFFKDTTVFLVFPFTSGSEILAVYGDGTTGVYEKHNYSYPNGKSGYLIIEYTK